MVREHGTIASSESIDASVVFKNASSPTLPTLPTIDEQNVSVAPTLHATTFETDSDNDSISTVSSSPIIELEHDLSLVDSMEDEEDDDDITYHSSDPALAFFINECDDELSISSFGTEALRQIKELTTKLRIQENTKLELLKQCLELQRKNSAMSKEFTSPAYLRVLKKENNLLKESSARMERNFMNDINGLVQKNAKLESDLEFRDEKIKRLEKELKALKS